MSASPYTGARAAWCRMWTLTKPRKTSCSSVSLDDIDILHYSRSEPVAYGRRAERAARGPLGGRTFLWAWSLGMALLRAAATELARRGLHALGRWAKCQRFAKVCPLGRRWSIGVHEPATAPRPPSCWAAWQAQRPRWVVGL